MCDTMGFFHEGSAIFAKNSDRSPNEPQVRHGAEKGPHLLPVPQPLGKEDQRIEKRKLIVTLFSAELFRRHNSRSVRP